MKILVVCQHYWPEPFNTSDVCEELVGRGHSVSVITGLPNTGMPNSDIPEEYKNRQKQIEHHNGVTVYRANLYPRKNGCAQSRKELYLFLA